MDITIEVMLPPRGAADYSQEMVGSWRVLSVVGVYDHLKNTPVIGMPRTGYIHVLNVPDFRFPGLKRVLEREWAAGDAIVERRLWRCLASRMTVLQRRDLRIDRQITVGWLVFRSWLQDLQALRDLLDADMD